MMACEWSPWDSLSYLSEFEMCLEVGKLDGSYMNLKIQMAGDDANFEVKGGSNVIEALHVDPFRMGIKSSLTADSGSVEGAKGIDSDIGESLSDQLFAAMLKWKKDEDLRSWDDSDCVYIDNGSYDDCLPQNVEELLNYALASICSVTNKVDNSSQTEIMAYPDVEDDDMPDSSSYDDSLPENVEELLDHALTSICVFGNQADHSTQATVYTNTDKDGGAVNDALFFVLSYLGTGDLLSVQGVCKSLNDAVKRDSHLWRNICLDAKLSSKISDNTLLQLTSRADGALESLSLMGCNQITDCGLAYVLEYNPGISMIGVPDCMRLTIDGIVSSLKVFTRTTKPWLKYLRIAGLYGVANKHIEELKMLLHSNEHTKPRSHKPMFYHMAQRNQFPLDDFELAIETCSQCEEYKLVYDFPVESKNHAAENSRGCIICISRCIICGGCTNDCHITETFCLDDLCWVCLKGEI